MTKKRKNKPLNKPLITFFTIIFSVLISFGILAIYYYNTPYLSEYNIISVSDEKNGLIVNLSKSDHATKYFVDVYDESDNLLLSKNSNDNKVNISDLVLNYNEKVIIKSHCINRKNEEMQALNEYEYNNNSAAFSMIEDHFADDKRDINLYLIGYNDNEKYSVDIYEDNLFIKKIDDVINLVTIKHEDIIGHEGKLTAKLKNKYERVISEFNFYLNAPNVSDIKITSPSDNIENIWDDIVVKFDGGINANVLRVQVYNKKNKIIYSKVMPFSLDDVIIPASTFLENDSYKIELLASYNDYIEIAKKDIININITEKQTVNPVYINKNNTFIKSGTKVSLLSRTTDATIYYTTDGKNPTTESKIYTEPIIINSNMTIKAFADRKNMNRSDTNTYDFTIKDKGLVVYLSPSNQYGNKGVSKVGYTNEKEMMNKLGDHLEKYLKDAGVKVYRNNKASGAMNDWLAESNRVKSDLHLAIHSNASEDHDKKGIEIYVDKQTSKSLSIATNIYNNLYSIYPYQTPETDRGVKFADGALGEANDNFISCGTLIEVAYHDDLDDAAWIVNNMDEIAKNMSDTILRYYGVIE